MGPIMEYGKKDSWEEVVMVDLEALVPSDHIPQFFPPIRHFFVRKLFFRLKYRGNTAIIISAE